MPQHIPILENRRLKEEFEDTKGVIRITGARGTDLSSPFFLTIRLKIYFQ